MASATGKTGWDSGLLLIHRSVRFYCGTDTCVWVLPKASKHPGYRSGKWPRSVTPWELYKQQRGPRPGGEKLKAPSRDQKSGKGTSPNCSSSWKSKCARRNKAQNNKTHEGSMGRAKSPGNYPDFIVPSLLPADEKKENNRSSKQGWPKPLKYWCRNWTFLLEIWNWSHMELLC